MEKVYLKENWKLLGAEIGTLDAEVPGCVHTDLINHGIIKDIFWRDGLKTVILHIPAFLMAEKIRLLPLFLRALIPIVIFILTEKKSARLIICLSLIALM